MPKDKSDSNSKRTKSSLSHFFDHKVEQILPLSTLKADEPLYQGILALEKAIMFTGHGMMDSHLEDPRDRLQDREWLALDLKHSIKGLEGVKKLIRSPLNAKGDLYKYWFDVSGKNHFVGNHVLLTAISRACHSLSQSHSDVVCEMVLMIIHDACSKLSPECFKNFISFRFIPNHPKGENVDYYFDNTPLTLSIVTGLRQVADKLLGYNLLSKEDINIQTGEGYIIKNLVGETIRENPMLLSAAHLAALRFSVTKLKSDFQLLTKLHECGADFKLFDEFNHSVIDLATISIPQFTPDCGIRRTEKLSSYAHRLEYDACFKDNYDAGDSFNPYQQPIIRSLDIFPAPSKRDKLTTHQIEMAIQELRADDAEICVDKSQNCI